MTQANFGQDESASRSWIFLHIFKGRCNPLIVPNPRECLRHQSALHADLSGFESAIKVTDQYLSKSVISTEIKYHRR